MTAVATQAGALSHAEVNWHAINWRKAHQNVRRLQARIVKATQEQRWGKVRALQHLLTHSFYGKALAVRRVTENQGKQTPGVDKQIWNTPEKKAQAVSTLRPHGYRPLPLRRVYIPKSNGQLRPLSIPAMKDRAMQALYLQALDPVAETVAEPNSYGFRKARSTADAIGQCFRDLCGEHSASWILEADLKSCFDRIDHSWLLENIPMDKNILCKWLKAGFMEKNALHPTKAGTPQGGICSPVLMNFTLNGLEESVKESSTTSEKVHMVRWADDFIVTSSSKELLETKVLPVIEKFLKIRGLELSREKTKITHIEEGFDFLGQNLRKYNGKLLIKPARKNIKAFLNSAREVVTTRRQAKAGELVGHLNAMISGWANYHRHVVSKETFASIDSAIFKCLWGWARRRHPLKSRRWVKEKYFTTRAGDQWVFSGTVVNKTGEKRRVYLMRAASVPIKRHIKIKGAANPYDPAWETYFERRLDVQMASDLRRRRHLLYLWQRQQGYCPVCQQKITRETGWHSHHLIWRVHGGPDTAKNRVLLHPECHRQVHSQGLTVVKPRPLKGR